MSVRLRYAPSPTGDPHVGNIRTALWSWFFARREGGQFIVRLEDTDQSRSVPGSLERILESLRWLGIDWDEGPDIGGPYAPYVQSERLELYQTAAARLRELGHAYFCFCTAEELRAMRERQRAESAPPGYDGRCRAIDPAEAARRAASEPHVTRFRMPDDGTTSFHDLLRGEITVENSTQEDFVILKTDGFPTYHLAHPVDDHEMRITHVTRGEEWLPSAPRHQRIFDALGYAVPIYVHNSIILGPDGGKLSKRYGAKFVLEYAAEGYLPEAVVNFLVMLGWSLDDHTEVISRERLREVFDITRLSVTPAAFDTQKLEWMNGVYMRDVAEERLLDLFTERLEADLPESVARPIDRALVAAILPHVRERIKLLSELTPLVDFFFTGDVAVPALDQLLGKPYRDDRDGAAAALRSAVASLQPLSRWETDAIEVALREAAEEIAQRAGNLFMLCRLAVTGKPVTPPLFETMQIVGRDTTIGRLRAAQAVIEAAKNDG